MRRLPRKLLPLLSSILIGTLVAGASPGVVNVEICEKGVSKDNSRLEPAAAAENGIPAGEVSKESQWPENPVVTEKYTEEAFGFFELPQKYIATGVRADRAFPTLVRAIATVTLPAGNHRLLLRARGQSRVLINGKMVLETPFAQATQYVRAIDGFLPLEEQDSAVNLGPGYRHVPPGNREALATVQFAGKPVTVVLETLIGQVSPALKSPFRPELGETVVAVALEGSTEWRLLSPGKREVPYTDAGWEAYAEERRQRLAAMDQAARRARRLESGEYWARRRKAATAYLASTPEEPVPALPAGYPGFNAIDHFIGNRIQQVAAQAGGSEHSGKIDFYRDIKPILETRCYDCHQGAKVKGGLRLDSLAAALAGGKADGPAIVPHKPDESSLVQRILSTDSEEMMPAKGGPLPKEEIEKLRLWIDEGASWPEFPVQSFVFTPLTDDLTFIRRVFLDTVGVTPNEEEINAFLADKSVDRRTRLIDRLLADQRWADNQMGYWLDVLAENPNIINPTLNNTGPFRWWVYESMLDNKPLDLMVTELIRMQGSVFFGGPAGFGMASENDVPMAAKGIIVSSAFLGVEMQCARCHDAPTHVSKQEDLFQLAAMLAQKPIKVPITSSVSLDKLKAGGRKPLISVTLLPDSVVQPAWPFTRFVDEQVAVAMAEDPKSPRDRLAAMITAPQNERFAEVMVNRTWQRLMGRGLVDTVNDWEKSTPSHPHLLRWLAREFVRTGYDQKAIIRLILTSHAYQRAVDPTLAAPSPLFVAPAIRRIGAEQLVDSLFAATGKSMAKAVGPVAIDIDGARPVGLSLNLGRAHHAWTLTSGSNERDRPSLQLPRLQAVTEVLEVFGWNGARVACSSGIRDVAPNVLQPALLANGTMMTWLTRLSDDHALTALALEEQPLEKLVDRLFLRLFTRHPSAYERAVYVAALKDGYETRKITAKTEPVAPPPPRKFVAWSNHNIPEANILRMEEDAEAKRGDPATRRLAPAWRNRFEDVIWAMLNAPEWAREF
jgi:hypothetical protein